MLPTLFWLAADGALVAKAASSRSVTPPTAVVQHERFPGKARSDIIGSHCHFHVASTSRYRLNATTATK